MKIGLMIEGQENLTWDLWRRTVTAVEAQGFESLWRSDHFQSLTGPRTREALETFLSFAVAAELTERIRLGSLVASVTFRHPSLVARMAAQIDVLSGGRFILGVGAGWNVPEHEAFGITMPPLRERMDRLEESIRVMRALWADGKATFHGRYYQLAGAECQPKPVQRPLPIVVGGRGVRRTLRIVAEHANEWNLNDADLTVYRDRRMALEQHCAEVGRDPATIMHSQLTPFIVGVDEPALRRHLDRVAAVQPALRGEPAQVLNSLRTAGWLIGTPSQIAEDIRRREEAGIERVMLQHFAHDDFASLELIAQVLPLLES